MEARYEKSEYIFEISEVQSFRKIYIEIFLPSRKYVHFFHLHFSSSFSNFLKIFIAFNSSTQNYLFNEVFLLIISFHLQEQLTKMYELPIEINYILVVFSNFSIFFWQKNTVSQNLFFFLVSHKELFGNQF